MVGIDIIDVARIGRVIAAHGDRFLQKIFTEEEIEYSRRKRAMVQTLAGRFAAKEAFMKAVGRRLAWKEIRVLQREGRPYISFDGREYGGVSISHERAYAVSVVVIQ
jgi:holo-[acyl-carrier-protein] synthase